ncbi:type II toxin-antitoxin system RelB/DinJ family antitoxin (plasmid) [Acetobacter orientalis]|uniref:type II toxin-antitoxin system RelB/DinJ family antitoxin n=1 Tax=Acetobacter orientalis TaxID=146474 RepID=UPI0038656945
MQLTKNNSFISQVNIKLDSALKENAYATLKQLGTNPSDFFREMLEYVVREKKLPIKKVILSDEDEELLALAKEALASDEPDIEVDINDLSRTLHIEIPAKSRRRLQQAR